MYRNWLMVFGLMISVYCLTVFLHQLILYRKAGHRGNLVPKLSLLLLVRNQQDIIEGVIRGIRAQLNSRPVELIIIDRSSNDQTMQIIERLSIEFPDIRIISDAEVPPYHELANLCDARDIYCFDITGPVNFSLLSQTIHSIIEGSRTSLYRTQVLYKNETVG